MKDIKNKINSVLKTGKAVIGSKSVEKALLIGNPKLIILSNNCPEEEQEDITYYSKLAGVVQIKVSEDSLELGSLCGKPFPVSAIGILDEGESGIITALKE